MRGFSTVFFLKSGANLICAIIEQSVFKGRLRNVKGVSLIWRVRIEIIGRSFFSWNCLVFDLSC